MKVQFRLLPSPMPQVGRRPQREPSPWRSQSRRRPPGPRWSRGHNVGTSRLSVRSASVKVTVPSPCRPSSIRVPAAVSRRLASGGNTAHLGAGDVDGDVCCRCRHGRRWPGPYRSASATRPPPEVELSCADEGPVQSCHRRCRNEVGDPREQPSPWRSQSRHRPPGRGGARRHNAVIVTVVRVAEIGIGQGPAPLPCRPSSS